MCVQVTVGEDPDTTDSRVKFLYSMTEWLLMSEMDAGAVKCETVTDVTKILRQLHLMQLKTGVHNRCKNKHTALDKHRHFV